MRAGAALLLAGCSLTPLAGLSGGNDAAVAPLFSDDFEVSGPLPDAGGWTRYATASPQNGLRLGPEGAHRGSSGLTLEDRNAGAGDSAGSRVHYELDASIPDAYLRYWLRVRENNNRGYVLSGYFEATNGTHPAFSGFTGGFYILIGEHEDGGMQTKNQETRFSTPAAWELLELSARGCDGRTCLVQLFTGGRDAGAFTINRASLIDSFGLGSIFHGQEFVGVADFDDVRLSTVPHASTLVVSSDAGAVGRCSPMRVELVDAFGAPAFAPYDFEAELWVDGGEAFGDEGCTTAPRVQFRRGGQAVAGWWRPEGQGPYEASAGYVDFMSARRLLLAR